MNIGIELSKELLGLTKRVAFARARKGADSGMSALQEVVISEGHIVACDGKRLAWVQLNDTQKEQLADLGREVWAVNPKTGFLENQVFRFPDWPTVRDRQKIGASLTFQRKQLESVLTELTRVAQVAAEIDHGSKKGKPLPAAAILTVRFGTVTLGLHVQSDNPHAATTWEIPAQNEVGQFDGLFVAFNPKFLLDFVKAAKGATVSFFPSEVEAESMAFKLESDGLQYVQMPIRIREAAEVVEKAPKTAAEPKRKKKTLEERTRPRNTPETTAQAVARVVTAGLPSAPATKKPEPKKPESKTSQQTPEEVKIQMRRGQRHWRTKNTVTSIQEAKSYLASVAAKPNQSWRAISAAGQVVA